MPKTLRRLLRQTGLSAAAFRLWQVAAKLYTPWKVRQYLKGHDLKKLQIGTGINVLAGWLNTDLLPDPRRGEIAFLDARKRFPFADCAFDYVFSEHLIEHMEYAEGVKMLRECFRVLRPGGKIRIATPDLRFLVGLYSSEKTDLQKRYIVWAVDTHISKTGIHQDVFVINNFFQSWGHRFIYDERVLTDTLVRIGFRDVMRCAVGDSTDDHLKGLESHGRSVTDEFNRLETLVVEATRAH